MVIKKTSVLLYDRENDPTGIVRVTTLLRDTYGCNSKQIRQILSRFPAILSKDD